MHRCRMSRRTATRVTVVRLEARLIEHGPEGHEIRAGLRKFEGVIEDVLREASNRAPSKLAICDWQRSASAHDRLRCRVARLGRRTTADDLTASTAVTPHGKARERERQ